MTTCRRAGQFLFAMAFVGVLAGPAEASVIDLGTPLGGNGALGELFELTVSFDLNGAADNLVGMELYVDFAGFTTVPGSYQLGSVFGPQRDDVLASDGDCATVGCNDPGGAPAGAGRYLSFASVFAPLAPTGPGTLFTLQFFSTGLPWSLNLLGDSDYAMLTDRTATGGSPVDAMPFAIVSSAATAPFGTAQITVDLRSLAPVPVPEPASMLLTGAGLAAVARVVRRRRRVRPVTGAL